MAASCFCSLDSVLISVLARILQLNNVHTLGMRFDKTERRTDESNEIDSGIELGRIEQ